MTLRESTNGRSLVQLHAMRQRVQALYRQGSNSIQHDQVLNMAFEELALALEELQAAEDELRRQQEQWLNNRTELELECQRYKDLFEHAPAGYIVTSMDGSIRQVNPAAAALLQNTERLLIGRSLALFVPEGQRRPFRHQIAQLAEAHEPQEWEVSMQTWEGTLFQARLTASLLRSATGRPVALYWLLHDISTRSDSAQPTEPAPSTNENHPGLNGVQNEREDVARRQFGFLAEVSPLLAIAQDANTTLMHVAHLAVPAIADGVVIDLAEPQSGAMRRLMVVREPGMNRQSLTFQRSYTPDKPGQRRAKRAAVAEQGRVTVPEPLLADLARDAELRSVLDALALTSAIVVPLQARGALLGSLTFLLSGIERRYGPNDLALAEELARRLAIAIDRIQGFQAALA